MTPRKEMLITLSDCCPHGCFENPKSVSAYQSECCEFAECCGFTVRRNHDNCGNTNRRTYLEVGSLTLLPSLFPRSMYELALQIQPALNKLCQLMSEDSEFLHSCLVSTIDGDEFTRNLWRIFQQTHNDPKRQTVALALLRSDYMYQKSGDSFSLGQIEMNTIATSMYSHSVAVNSTHRHMAGLYSHVGDASTFPSCEALNLFADSLVQAWKAYDVKKAVVMIVRVAGNEGNFTDIRKLQYEVEKAGCTVLTVALESLFNITLDSDRRLFVQGREVAVIYYRCAYIPAHFTSEVSWNTRLVLEQSVAIKCPTVGCQLAGSKKVQQELTRPGVLEKYLTEDECRMVRQTFLAQISLSEPDAVIEEALKNHNNYVLKPQREGGGHNYYGDDILEEWRRVRHTAERHAYILMERIQPPSQLNCMLPCRGETCCKPLSMINELGIYGGVLWDGTHLLKSGSAGYLLRTKPANVDEGGFMTGASGIDTPLLVDDSELLATNQ